MKQCHVVQCIGRQTGTDSIGKEPQAISLLHKQLYKPCWIKTPLNHILKVQSGLRQSYYIWEKRNRLLTCLTNLKNVMKTFFLMGILSSMMKLNGPANKATVHPKTRVGSSYRIPFEQPFGAGCRLCLGGIPIYKLYVCSAVKGMFLKRIITFLKTRIGYRNQRVLV